MRELVGTGSAPVALLEARVHQLEARVEVLVEVIDVLAHGLEAGPLAESGQGRAEKAARQARDLLLLARRPPH